MEEENIPPTGAWNQAALEEASAKTKRLTALFANQLFVQPDGLHLRLSFGEKVAGESLFHTSIVVPNGDALEFGQLLVTLAQAAIEQQVEAMKQAFGPQDASDGE